MAGGGPDGSEAKEQRLSIFNIRKEKNDGREKYQGNANRSQW
jgi:hypothetical protein